MTWLRRLRSMLVFLLLGAMINIAIAWGCTMWSPANISRKRSIGPWPAPVGEQWPDVANLSTTIGFGFAETQADGWLRAGPPQYGFTSQWSFRAGWPCHSVYTARSTIQIAQSSFVPIQATAPSNLKEGIATNTTGGDGILKLKPNRFLPTLPLWKGFVLNSLLYAAIFGVFFAAPGALRRRRRIKRGLCPVCAYPVGTSPICTECGKPVTPRAS